MSSYYKPNNNYINNDEQIFQKMFIKMPNNKRIYLSASTTVEASIVIPLFIYAVMTIMYLIQIVGFQLKVQQALYSESRKIAKYMFVYEKLNNKSSEKNHEEMLKAAKSQDADYKYNSILYKGIEIGLVQTLFYEELGPELIKNSNVIGGVAGFNFLQSNIMSDNHMINIVVTYSIKNPYDIFGIAKTTFTQSASTNAWVGEQTNNDAADKEETSNETMVYITQSGSVYHTKRNCSYLVLSIHEISIENLGNQRNESGGKYYACEKCGNKPSNGKLYITEFGDRFHTTKNCSSIMRCIIEVKLSQVMDKQQCSKCKGD